MNFIKNIKLQNRTFYLFILFYLLSLFVYSITSPSNDDPYNYFVWLADAFINGRLNVIDPPAFLEEFILYHGKYYALYPPFPAILIIPSVVVFGKYSSLDIPTLIIGSLNVSVIYLIVGRVVKNLRSQIWLVLLFAFGTIHWFTSTVGSTWYFAHVVSLLFLSLAIYETLNRRRALVIGLFLGAAYWSRLPTIISLPFFLLMLSDQWIIFNGDGGVKRYFRFKPLFLFALGLGVFILLNFLYNYLRFGTPFDIYYSLHKVSEFKQSISLEFDKGLFNINYLKYHIYTFLLKPPEFVNEPPYVIPSLSGLSVLITTPAFIFAFSNKIKDKLTIACWLGIIPVGLVIFMKSGTGWTQFGYRYALDFYPFLLLLTFRGIGDKIMLRHKILIVLSIIVNTWGVLCINFFDKYKHW